jgi:hypothetical protein
MTYEHTSVCRDRTTLSRIGRAVDDRPKIAIYLLFRNGKTRYRLTVYLVNAPPAWVNEFGPSAAYTFPSASTATPSPAVP